MPEFYTKFTETKLGSNIDPEDVRLKPDAQDGYRWNTLPEREHLFTKQLSKQSIGAYMELCREVGKSFEAEALPTFDLEQGESVSPDARQTATVDDNFSSIISQLKDENARIKEELEHRTQEAQLEADTRRRWEQRSQNLEADLQNTRDDLDNARHEKHRLTKKVRSLARRMDVTQREVGKALVSLQKVERSAPNGLWKVDTERIE
jgi:chromosome segregation ATPase